MADEKLIHQKFTLLKPTLNERARRLWAAVEAKTLGRGGISAVARATGLARKTIRTGLAELKTRPIETTRIRKKGGGRKHVQEKDKTLETHLKELVDSTTRGDPESPLCYTTKSTRKLMEELAHLGHKVSYPTIATLLRKNNYSLQANKKTREGTIHPDRNAQFEFINQDVKTQLQRHEPVISVDTKKKELIGDFKNNGREWRPKGHPVKVRVHDFENPALGKAVPYGVYDLGSNHGWVNVGVDNDTAEFAVESIRRWWKIVGRQAYPNATAITITADCGGSNSPRARLWKCELQRFANETGLVMRVRHFPPGTSKWNKIEHRLFSFISQNWRGKPLYTLATVVSLIAATATKTGLKVRCVVDRNKYPTGKKISDEAYARVSLEPADFHGEWNYSIKPNRI